MCFCFVSLGNPWKSMPFPASTEDSLFRLFWWAKNAAEAIDQWCHRGLKTLHLGSVLASVNPRVTNRIHDLMRCFDHSSMIWWWFNGGYFPCYLDILVTIDLVDSGYSYGNAIATGIGHHGFTMEAKSSSFKPRHQSELAASSLHVVIAAAPVKGDPEMLIFLVKKCPNISIHLVYNICFFSETLDIFQTWTIDWFLMISVYVLWVLLHPFRM